MLNADYFINKLQLKEHPEGGYYYEIFSSKAKIKLKSLPEGFSDDRKYYTSIYFLLKSEVVSRFHRIKSDEIWNYHAGSPLDIHIIDKNGAYSIKKLGLNLDNDEKPQQIVKAGCWFGAAVSENNNFSFVGCFVSPGFDFEDFELADREELLKVYPQYADIVKQLTKVI